MILTQNHKQRQVEALAIAGDRIAGAGSLFEMREKAGAEAEYIDLHGHTLMPAFNDAHIHIWKVGDLLTYMLDLRGVKSMGEMLEKIADYAAKHPNNPWILARGFNEIYFRDGQFPTRYDLDKAVSDRPCHVIRTCAHIVVMNTKALEICGIDKETPVPNGGEIRLDKDGTPSGILTETALGLAKKHLPANTPDRYRDMIRAAQDAFLKVGIGSATDPAVPPDLLEVYRAMEKAGELKVRINAVPILVPDGDTFPLSIPERYESDFLTINTVKFFSDGGLSSKTAALKHHYKNSREKGVLRLEFDSFKTIAAKAQAAGFRIATHAIGDQAIELVLQVYESIAHENTSKKLRHRIEHLGMPELSHLVRMRKLGIHCVSQPIFLYELGENFRNSLPESYLNNIYPYRSILDSGVNLAFSSDAPVVKDFNPLMGIRNAIERKDRTGASIAPDQGIAIAEALKAYTHGAALANGTLAKKGTLGIGKYADFVILDRNPLEIALGDSNGVGEELTDIRVLETWVGGNRYTE